MLITQYAHFVVHISKIIVRKFKRIYELSVIIPKIQYQKIFHLKQTISLPW